MQPFLGSEALAAGVLTRGALRWNYTAVHPNVYLDKDAARSLYVNAIAAWLWTRRTGVIAGKAAASLHGVRWIPENEPIELIANNGRRRAGVVVREERISDDEVSVRGDYRIRLTTPARTALDLARRLPRAEALEHLDALAAKTGITPEDVFRLAERYPATRGIRAARAVIGLMDGGASSPRQTQLRLMMRDAGLPRPRTSIVLEDDQWRAVLAIGWEGPRVGLEHEEDLEDMNPMQRIERDELFHRLGWFPIRVLRQHSNASILHRVRSAIKQRR